MHPPLTYRLLLALLLSSASAALLAQDPPYKRYTVTDGLPSNSIYMSVQDSMGYLWFATEAGACRFDGHTFQTFTTLDGLSDNEVLSIFQDSKGRIWFLTLNGKPCYFQNEKFHSERNDPAMKGVHGCSGLSTCAEDTLGGIWFTDLNSGVVHFGSDGWRQYESKDLPVPIPNAGVMRAFRYGRHSIGLQGKDVYDLSGSAPRFLRTYAAPPFPVATPMPNGHLAVLTTGGLMEWGGAADGLLLPNDELGDAQRMVVTRNGDLWMQSGSQRLFRFRATPRGFGHAEKVAPTRPISDLYEDRSGGLWLSTTGKGLLHVSLPGRDMLIHSFRGVDGNEAVLEVLALGNGRVIVGTDHGGLYDVRDSGQAIKALVPSGDARDHMHALERDAKGGLWCATDRHVWRYDPVKGREEVFYLNGTAPSGDELCASGMKGIRIAPDGHVYASFFGVADVTDITGKRVIRMNKRYWPGQDRVYALYADSTGTLWFETDEHLHSTHNGVLRSYPELDSLFHVRITDIEPLDGSTLVISTAGSGVVLLREGKLLKQFTAAVGLCSDQCRHVSVRNGAIILATDNGVSVIEDPLGTPSISNWTMLDGLPTSDVQDADADDMVIYLGTSEGLCIVPWRPQARHLDPPPLRITSVSVNGRVIHDPGKVELGWGQRDLVIMTRAFEFNVPEGVRYQYKIDEGDQWHDDRDGTFILAGLPAGDHNIAARASVSGSKWSVPVWINVVVHAPWYRTTWFMVLTISAISGALAMAVLLFFRRRVKQRNAEHRRKSLIAAERLRIATDVHDDLGADVSNLLLLARMGLRKLASEQPDRSALTRIEGLAGGMLQKIDEIIWSLDPANDKWEASVAFIDRYAMEFASQHHFSYRSDLHELNTPITLSAQKRRDLYLAVKEILQNVAEHAEANQIVMSGRIADGRLGLSIMDNGVGIVEDAASTGHGRNNMRERVSRWSGTLTVTTLRPGGTTVRISLPLDE